MSVYDFVAASHRTLDDSVPDPQVHITRQMSIGRRARAILEKYKVRVGCKDCKGLFLPEALDFDHVPGRGHKLFNLAAPFGWTAREIAAEFRKCDVVCANCHRTRTRRRSKTGLLSPEPPPGNGLGEQVTPT